MEKGSSDNQKVLSLAYDNTMAIIIKTSLDFATNKYIFNRLNNQIYKLQKHNEEFVILTTDKIIRLDDYQNEHFRCDEIVVLLALDMKLRVGKICALSWANIVLTTNNPYKIYGFQSEIKW